MENTKTFKSNCGEPSYYTRKRGHKLPNSIRKAKKQFKKTYCRMMFPDKKVETLFNISVQPRRCNPKVVYKVYFCLQGARRPFIS